jgi:hypothetical protein
VEALICGGLKLEWLNDLSRIDIGGGAGALPLNIGGQLTAFARLGLVVAAGAWPAAPSFAWVVSAAEGAVEPSTSVEEASTGTSSSLTSTTSLSLNPTLKFPPPLLSHHSFPTPTPTQHLTRLNTSSTISLPLAYAAWEAGDGFGEPAIPEMRVERRSGDDGDMTSNCGAANGVDDEEEWIGVKSLLSSGTPNGTRTVPGTPNRTTIQRVRFSSDRLRA